MSTTCREGHSPFRVEVAPLPADTGLSRCSIYSGITGAIVGACTHNNIQPPTLLFYLLVITVIKRRLTLLHANSLMSCVILPAAGECRRDSLPRCCHTIKLSYVQKCSGVTIKTQNVRSNKCDLFLIQ